MGSVTILDAPTVPVDEDTIYEAFGMPECEEFEVRVEVIYRDQRHQARRFYNTLPRHFHRDVGFVLYHEVDELQRYLREVVE